MSYLIEPGDLETLFEGEPDYRADQLRDWLYRRPVFTTSEMTNLPIETRQRLEKDLWPFVCETEQIGDSGATVKWLFRTPDGVAIEAVLMGYPGRATLCVSSQAGCALGCTFCATGQFGFDRHLESGEIVAQVAWAQAYLRTHGVKGAGDHLTNLVFMGMGEPLANYDRVRESIRRIIEEMGMSARSITVSTVGMVGGIRKLAEEPWPVNLAVSLHASDDETRDSLVPLNKRYPLAEVEDSASFFFAQKGRRVSIEWAMIAGINDSPAQAAGLIPIARRLGAHVNLIPLNPTPLSSNRPSTRADIESFACILADGGVNVTIRDTRGKDIDGACGQLRLSSAPSQRVRGQPVSHPSDAILLRPLHFE